MISSFLGLFASLLSFIPLVLYFTSGLLPVLFFLLSHFIFFIIYRFFIPANIYDLEVSDSLFKSSITIFIFMYSIILSVIIFSNIDGFIWGGIIVISLHYLYLFIIPDYIKSEEDNSVVNIKLKAFNYINKYANYFIMIKIIAIIILYLLNRKPPLVPFYITILIDFFIIIINRKKIFYLERLKSEYRVSRLIIYTLLAVGFISFVISFNIAIYPYIYIIMFLNWLFTLGESSEYPDDLFLPKNSSSTTVFEELVFTDNKSIEPIIDLSFLYSFLEKVSYVFIVFLILKFIIIPVFKPLVKKRKKKVTLKEYLLHLIKWLKSFFTAREHIKIGTTLLKTKKIKRDKLKINNKKQKKILNKYYSYVIKWIENNTKQSPTYSLSVNELLSFIKGTTAEEYKDILCRLFNKAFYSDINLSSSEIRELKNSVKKLVKCKSDK